MIVFFPNDIGIDRTIQQNIRNCKYTESEIAKMSQEFSDLYFKRQNSFKMVTLTMFGILILYAFLGFFSPPFKSGDYTSLVFAFALCTVTITLALLFAKFIYIDNIKRQFNKALDKGYPHLFYKYKITTYG